MFDRWLGEPPASGPYVPNGSRQYLGSQPAVNGYYKDESTKGPLVFTAPISRNLEHFGSAYSTNVRKRFQALQLL
jgi:hypothetical protein